MKVITYRIELLEPTLVTALDGDPNSAIAYNFLPGSVLRGAIIGLYLRNNKLKELDIQSADHRRLFFSGETRFLNGYLMSWLADRNQLARSLPTPFSLHKVKGGEDSYHNFAHSEGDVQEQWQSVTSGFCIIHDESVLSINPKRHIAIHTMRDREAGRAKEGSGAVFRYESLAKDQIFEAAVLCERDEDADILCGLLKGSISLGGSVSTGYGRAKIENSEIKDDWQEVPRRSNNENNGRLVITLLSDSLIRDKNGQYTIDPYELENAISLELGCPLQLDTAFIRGRVVGGFNRKWGLPLPQAIVAQMGSVLVFNNTNCTKDQLKSLEWKGIGERRVEGFGRVVVNWHGSQPNMNVVKPVEQSAPQSIQISDAISRELAERMVRRLFRKRLDERLTEKVHLTKISSSPSKSQIARLRSIIRDELFKDDPSLSRVSDYLKQVNERSSSRKQFVAARIGNLTLIAWIEDIINKIPDDKWGEAIGCETTDMLSIGDIKPLLDDRLKSEYLFRLIDGVLAKAAKDKQSIEGNV